MSRGRFAVIVVTLLAAISPLFAQTGRVRVRVTDPIGTPVAEAEVSLLGVAGKAVQTSLSDKTGEAVFEGLPMGDVAFAVSATGFKTRSSTVRLRSGDDVKVEVRLDLGAVTMIDSAETPPTGRARIRVLDSSGHPIANPTASLFGPGHNLEATVGGNSAGEIVFEDIPVGRGDFLVKATGFKAETVNGNYLTEGKELNIEAVLQLGDLTTTISVCSDCPWVRVDSSELVPQIDLLPIPVHKFYVSGLKE
jgi:hypothetical protein